MDEKNEFEKIGVNVIEPFKSKDRWIFKKNGQIYDLAPAGATQFVLSPLVVGVDKLVGIGCKLKEIKNPEEGFLLLFSKDYFANADVKFVLKEPSLNGWIYDVEPLNFVDILPGQKAWICPYLTMYFEKPPQELYLKIESKQ